MIGDDLEVIPTSGRTLGTTSYDVLPLGNEAIRFLFTGDFLWLDHGEWKARRARLQPSLTYLHRFSTDELKVDRAFVAGLHDQADHRTNVFSCIHLAPRTRHSCRRRGRRERAPGPGTP